MVLATVFFGHCRAQAPTVGPTPSGVSIALTTTYPMDYNALSTNNQQSFQISTFNYMSAALAQANPAYDVIFLFTNAQVGEIVVSGGVTAYSIVLRPNTVDLVAVDAAAAGMRNNPATVLTNVVSNDAFYTVRTAAPTSHSPTTTPTISPTTSPTESPTTASPTPGPTHSPTTAPTDRPTFPAPTFPPSRAPSPRVTAAPTAQPVVTPAPSTATPSASPTSPTAAPTASTPQPTDAPTTAPVPSPTIPPTSAAPTTDVNAAGTGAASNDDSSQIRVVMYVWVAIAFVGIVVLVVMLHRNSKSKEIPEANRAALYNNIYHHPVAHPPSHSGASHHFIYSGEGYVSSPEPRWSDNIPGGAHHT